MESVVRQRIRFDSDGVGCAGWHYPGSNGGCVVMSGGLAVTTGPGCDRFAARFADAGFSVLSFDPRRLGESAGEPRQVVSLRDQRRDWVAALDCAAELPEVDPSRLAGWSFSVSAGILIEVAAASDRLAAAIAQTPNLDGPAATRNAARFTTRRALLGTMGVAVTDAVAGLFGRAPRLIPLVGESGSAALLSTPDAVEDTDRALDPDRRYPDWSRAVAARSIPQLGWYRPAGRVPDVRCPLLLVAAEDDRTALAAPTIAAAARAQRGELVRVRGGHYAPFLDAHELVVGVELDFLRRHLLSS